MAKLHQTDECVLREVNIISPPGKTPFPIATFDTMGASFRVMNRDVFNGLNPGDRGVLEFVLDDKKVVGKYADVGVVFKRFIPSVVKGK